MNNPKFYPAWRYHPTEPLRVVTSAEEDAELLGNGWYDHPLKASAARLALDEAAAAGHEPEPDDAPQPQPKRSHHRRPQPSS